MPKRKSAAGSAPAFHKRARQSSSRQDGPEEQGYHTSARLDPTYGQRSAFPGLEDGAGALSDASDNDALAYLRNVRSEARNVPNLLVAPDRALELQNDIQGDEGWYSDGAYTGAPVDQSYEEEDWEYDEAEMDEEDEDAQEAYYNALRSRFAAFRESLLGPPPSVKSQSTTASLATDPFSKQPQWSYAFRFTAPTAQQVTNLSQEQVIRALARIESLLSKKSLTAPDDQGKHLGAWAWALLARCRAIGEMRSEEVAVLRLLGKTAVKLCKKLRRGQSEQSAMDLDDAEEPTEDGYAKEESATDDGRGGDPDARLVDDACPNSALESPPLTPEPTDVEDGEIGDDVPELGPIPDKDEAIQLELAKRRMLLDVLGSAPTASRGCPETGLLSEADSAADKQHDADGKRPQVESGEQQEEGELENRAFATLDIIVTVIGEEFGQRDLLDAREVWGEHD